MNPKARGSLPVHTQQLSCYEMTSTRININDQEGRRLIRYTTKGCYVTHKNPDISAALNRDTTTMKRHSRSRLLYQDTEVVHVFFPSRPEYSLRHKCHTANANAIRVFPELF